MKKSLKLHRETLHLLDGHLLKGAEGGAVSLARCSDGTSCPSYCQVSRCL